MMKLIASELRIHNVSFDMYFEGEVQSQCAYIQSSELISGCTLYVDECIELVLSAPSMAAKCLVFMCEAACMHTCRAVLCLGTALICACVCVCACEPVLLCHQDL